MAKFAYKGIPIRDAQGNVVAVQPVRGIVAPDGLTYPGELSRDAEGQAFTYNQVPDEYSPTPVSPSPFMTSEGLYLVTADGAAFLLNQQGPAFQSQFNGAQFDAAISIMGV